MPLLERLKFLAIYSSNLDEFFRVRMANNRNLLRLGRKTKKELDFDPKSIVREILDSVNTQQEEFSRIFQDQIIPELAKHNIILKRRLQLNEEQQEFVGNYFKAHMLPHAQPVLLVKQKIRPFLNNASLYLGVLLQDKDRENAPHEYAIVRIPSDSLPRFIQLPSPSNRYELIMLDDIVRHSISWMFPGYDILDTFSLKLTRDAELYIDDEFSGDLISKIKESLTKRQVGFPSRFVYDREMPPSMLQFLKEAFELGRYDILKEGRYHNNFDFFKFPSFGLSNLKDSPWPPLPYSHLEDAEDFFDTIREQDHMIHVPYHSYLSVVRFFEEAAKDPKVTHIRIVQYRVAKQSRIMQALMQAAKQGKQVSVFIEVKARFDEEANLQWGERLEKAGVKVNYSFPGLKVHAKLALVQREERGRTRLYTYLSTGNFHEDTAKVYSDFGLFTADTRITREVARIFSFLETEKAPDRPFRHLLVGQFNLREELENLIDYEINLAREGRKAEIILKMNSIQDMDMIRKLYEAGAAGVHIKLIVRGICCLVPGIKPYSEHIEAISIVDRFLEHARVFVFHHGGEDLIYLSSADWMVRNLSYRVETAFPVYQENLRRQILDLLQIQWEDNTKARILDRYLSNTHRRQSEAELPVRSQEETYYYLKRRAFDELEGEEE